MTSALSPTRALLVALACIAFLAAWSPVASAQEVPISATADVVTPVDPPPPPDPVLDPTPPPPPEPAPEPTQSDPPPPPPDPVVEPTPPTPPEPQGGQTTDRLTAQRDEPSARPESTSVAPQGTAPSVPSDTFTASAQLPPGGPGEEFALTGNGDAFILASGGSSGGDGPTALLASFSSFGSIATAATRVPALGARERAARQAAQANASTSGIVTVEDAGSTGLFLKMFGGGGGGGAAMMLLSVLGILAVIRLLPPEGFKDFLESTAVWRPSAYVPPIEHPG